VKTGAGALGVEGVLGVTGPVEVREGKLHGNFKTTGDLTVTGTPVYDANGALVRVEQGVLAPGNSTGNVAVGNDLWLMPDGRLEIEIEGTAFDSVSVAGTAYILGEIHIAALNTAIARGTIFPILQGRKTTAGSSLVPAATVSYAPSAVLTQLNVPSSNERFILIGDGIGAGTAYETLWNNYVETTRAAEGYEPGLALLVAQKSIASVPGVKVSAANAGVLPVLDHIATLPLPPRADVTAADSNFSDWFNSNADLFASLSRYSPATARALFAAALSGGDTNGDGVARGDGDDPAIYSLVSALRLDSLPGSAARPAKNTAARAVYDWLKTAYAFSAAINTTADAAALTSLVNAFSPAGYASLTGLAAASASAATRRAARR